MIFLDTGLRIVETLEYDVRYLYPIAASIYKDVDGRYTTHVPIRIMPKVIGFVVRSPTRENPKLKMAIFRK
jgi:hypothetical protein